MKTKGFTLVELLIVIAIIGILSSIVLSNLTGARAKANDAKIQSQLSNIRGSAELYFISNVCNSNSTSWAVQGSLASTTTYWCVDKGGTSKEKSTSIASSTSCA